MESGLYYYGARYYDPQKSVFHGVDPKADSFPSWSPYTYCINNPIKVIDPDGTTVFITGDESSAATEQLQTKNLKITRDDKTGRLSATGDAKTREERQLLKAINSTKVSVVVHAENSDKIMGEDNIRHHGGAFMGNTLIKEDGKPNRAIAQQVVNPSMTEAFDKENGSKIGQAMKHEVTEAFYGGLISLRKGIPAPPAFSINDRLIYDKAHRRAIKQQ